MDAPDANEKASGRQLAVSHGNREAATQPPAGSPFLAPGHTYASVTDKISTIVLTRRTPKGWLFGFGLSFALTMLLLYAITYLLAVGVGIWGVNIPVAWGFAIVNFVWWIGIGHAGTLISAILLLMRQEWRTSINRFAEAMTLFAVACAGLFPILHLGRPWFFYWLFPYPNTMDVWPQFRSPLVWDVFAVSTYGLVSLMFWYIGLIPDLATLRDRARSRLTRIAYGILAMGWRGSAVHWRRYEVAYWLLAGLATPLVISVHTVVSWDFAIAIVPGWHSTIFPPYFVAGAIFSGFAMVMTLAIPIRSFYGLEDFITMRHLQAMAKVLLGTGLIVAYGYMMEGFVAWYSGNIYEQYTQLNRMFGPYAPLFWSLMLCNVVVPQALWFQRIRANVPALFVIAVVVNIGMWLERFIIVVTSLSRDYLPSAWEMYYPTFWDFATFVGTIGLFLALLFLFIRVLPMISIFEMRELVSEAGEGRVDQGSTIDDGSRGKVG
jgi:Ni/Fe-hydrogenase subunit HybB-like protein